MPQRLLILLLLLLPAGRAGEMILSQSRQFAIYRPVTARITDRIPASSVIVEPQFLAVTAERIRQALVAEIPALGSGGQRIHIHIMDRVPEDGVVGILSTKYNDGWTYQVAVPPVVDELRLMKGLIKVSLLEFANRTASDKGADIPDWVSEGLCQQLYYSISARLVVNRSSEAWELTMRDLHGRTRQTLQTNDPPSFNNLTTLSPPPPKAPAEAYYQSSVHLLVYSLLKMPGGSQRFGAFLQLLPRAWNWQTAFRQAYNFQSMLDVEKWWALAFIEFTSRDQRQAWSRNASLQKLDDLLKTRIETRATTNALPQLQHADLKFILQQNDWAILRAALNEKISQLTYTSPHLARPVAALAWEYKKAIETYLNKRQKSNLQPASKTPGGNYQQALTADFIRRIDALDAKRRALAEATISAR